MLSDRVPEVLDEILDLPAADRSAALLRLTGGDEALRAEVASLLRAHDSSPGFLVVGPAADAPKRIGRYSVVRELGRGAMGIVYLAEDPGLGRQIALKTLASSVAGSEQRRARLREEARMLAAVNQPNVAHLYTFEEAEGIAFLTMEHVPGASLGERLRRGRLSLEESLDCARQIAAALEATHALGLVHRDLKPHNVRITPEGWVKVLDFGLATVVDAARGERCGTLGYMSPEQVEGQAATERADIWALGALLYECLTASPALARGGGADLVAATLHPSVAWDLLPAGLSDVVRAALVACFEREPSARPSATEMRRVLDDALLRIRAGGLVRAASQRMPGARPGNLPEQLSPFVGRSQVIRELARLIGESRLVTVTGIGGCGKTRTAIELARASEADFPDGIWFFDLAAIEAGDRLAGHLAHTLGVRQAPGGAPVEPIEAIGNMIGERRVLLLADNCEHLLDAAAACVTTLLRRCPALRVLATSREALRIEGEQVAPLPPMELPVMDQHGARARGPGWEESEALRLFVLRARARGRSFSLTSAELETAGAICRALDGLPLAIELAAAQTRALSLAEIRERAERSPLSLERRGRQVPERHQSLARMISWSHQLLAQEERTLFALLSVFRDGWTLRQAEEIAAAGKIDPWQISNTLSCLLDRSLVEVQFGVDAPRYRYLETVRSFAREELHARPDMQAAAESRALALWKGLIAESFPGERLPDAAGMKRVEAEYGNLAGALEMAIETGRIGAALELTAGLSRYWTPAGYLYEGRDWTARVLEASAASPESAPETLAIPVLSAASRFEVMLGRAERAAALAADAVARARALGDPRVLVRALQAAGVVEWHMHHIDPAQRIFLESLALARSIGDDAACLWGETNVAAACSVKGEHAEALPHYEEAIRLARRAGDRLAVAKGLLSVGRTIQLLGRPAEALAQIEESLATHREVGDAVGTAIALQSLGDAKLALGDARAAIAHLEECGRIRYRLGQPGPIASTLLFLSRATAADGAHERAAELMGGAVQIARDGDPGFLAANGADHQRWRSSLAGAIGAEHVAEAEARGARRDIQDLAVWAFCADTTRDSFGSGGRPSRPGSAGP